MQITIQAVLNSIDTLKKVNLNNLIPDDSFAIDGIDLLKHSDFFSIFYKLLRSLKLPYVQSLCV